MHRAAVVSILLTSLASGQVLVPAGELARVRRDFEQRPGEPSLRCDLPPQPPIINFAFRVEAGYTFHVPQSQSVSTRGWAVLTGITPELGDPTYLLARTPLADALTAGSNFDIRGAYFLGVGRYSVDSILRDDRNRVCRRQWQIDVAPARIDRNIPLALPPHAVRQALPVSNPATGNPDRAAPMRRAILLNAAAFSTHRTVIRETDRERIAGALTALLEHLPTTSLRVVVFSLEQQTEVLRADPFSPHDIDKVAGAIDALPQGTVDINLLKNPFGHVDFLAGLIRRELNESHPADTVIFLGPTSRYPNTAPKGSLPDAGESHPRFFYVRYEAPLRPYIGEMPAGRRSAHGSSPAEPATPITRNDPFRGLPDIITKAVAQLDGKSLIIHSPAELAGAIRKIEMKR